MSGSAQSRSSLAHECGHDPTIGRSWLGRIVVLGLAVGLLAILWPAQAQETAPLPASLADRLAARIAEQTGFQINGHEAGEGPQLSASAEVEHVAQNFDGGPCPSAGDVKLYEISAIETKIVLNRWGDYDPNGYMFTLTKNVAAVTAQAAAPEEEGYGLTLGLGPDVIQPLTLRASIGDCIRIRLTNTLNEPTSFHVHGADMVIAGTGDAALSTNPDAMALPGATVSYEWYVDPAYYVENTHYAHPHGPRARFQVSHGLFGAIIVEPEGAEYFDQRDLSPLCLPRSFDGIRRCRNSWDAIISPAEGVDFREYAMFYHEIGNAKFAAHDKNGNQLPIIDPVVHSYKPAGRAINYRSESFANRMLEAEEQVAFYEDWSGDEALAYSSYSNGDPAMPIPQSYLGDPVKFRLIHGGSETFHVPHLHGGGIQWQRQQDIGKDGADDYVPINAGLQKQFASSMPSSGNDSQTIGPSETYELEIGCGSGGCQQTVGDFLFHCHVASHYISGMWHFWRVYNTLQDTDGKTDQLAVLAELPDRHGEIDPAVTSRELIGETVDFSGRIVDVDAGNLADIVEIQLPPQGTPFHVQDAQVFDWVREGTLYLNEPESEYVWPNYESPTPLGRPPLMFAADTGKFAWPFLRPHLGERPPFAPHHGPAPYMEPFDHANETPSAPGSNGETSLCPTGTPRRLYNIHAVQTPIDVTSERTEPNGMIFVLKEHEAKARSDPKYKVPLAIRANQGDCVDVILTNELEGLPRDLGDSPNLMKTNIHIHFVQFDVQASDGVITGASFEQAPRPFTQEGQSVPILDAVPAGATEIAVEDSSIFHDGSVVAIGIDQATEIFETATIERIVGGTLVLADPLENAHAVGELVSAEFVRYRWYVARQNGAIYFHDHVDPLNRWTRGLFGALIAEPADATYHHPVTGNEITSGPIADIHTRRQVVPGLVGSFREFVLFMNDRNPRTGSSFNLRAEPLLADTDRGQGPAHLMLSSTMHGDPQTPILNTYPGDPVMIRLLTSATEEVHPFHITGHRFRHERFQANSPMISSFGVGISERFNAYIPAAGGPSEMPGDYLYYNGAERHFREGAWGIMRVHSALTEMLRPLPGRKTRKGSRALDVAQNNGARGVPDQATGPGDPCPASALVRRHAVSAIDTAYIINAAAGMREPNGRIYMLDADFSPARRPSGDILPLVLRANAGECLEIDFTNRSSEPASLYISGV
ncbi:MAG: multicopper oxidase domain-containing protein, partial [Alphaproteobacteria bacterium]|nr:multicopper oxidase domain-containing protein [Alphaproteobacteria bacterium]